jgi:hypothetical protein
MSDREAAIAVVAKGARCGTIITPFYRVRRISSKPDRQPESKNDESLMRASMKFHLKRVPGGRTLRVRSDDRRDRSFRCPDQPDCGEEVDSAALTSMPLVFDEKGQFSKLRWHTDQPLDLSCSVPIMSTVCDRGDSHWRYGPRVRARPSSAERCLAAASVRSSERDQQPNSKWMEDFAWRAL